MKIGEPKYFNVKSNVRIFSDQNEAGTRRKDRFCYTFWNHWREIPFGLVNGPATFQSFMNGVLGDTPDVLVYLDINL